MAHAPYGGEAEGLTGTPLGSRKGETVVHAPCGAKLKVPALCGIGVLTLQKEGEDSVREPPTAAAERKRKKFVTSNAAEETYNL